MGRKHYFKILGNMKTLLSLAILSFSLSSMANVITCSGQTTESSIVLGLTGKAFPLDKADYSFKNKLIPTSGYEFGINTNKDDHAQKLTYKFRTLKRHALAKNNSNLILTIKQNNEESDPFVFILNDTHDAELKLEVDGLLTLIDKMVCK